MIRAGALLAAWLSAVAPSNAQTTGQSPPPDTVSMSSEQQHTVGLKTATAERRPITEPVRVPGAIAFDPEHVAVLRTLAPARVTRLLAQPGDRVQAGQTWTTLEVPSLVDMQDSVASARASLDEATAGVAVARDALRRGEILARDGSLARAEAERRRLELAQASARLASARSHVATLEAQIRRLNPGQNSGEAALVSPIAGTVASIGITPGEYLDAGASSFTVADLSTVLALAQVPEISAPLIADGDAADVRLIEGSNRTWSGTVSALGAQLDAQARTLPARVTLANQDGALRAGMAVEVTITSPRGRYDVVVPATAVQSLGEKRIAFTPAGNDRFRSHELSLGVQQPDWIEVRRGLVAGDEVVTDGSFALKSLLQQALLNGGK